MLFRSVWPVFNLADSAIVIGAVLLAFTSLRVHDPMVTFVVVVLTSTLFSLAGFLNAEHQEQLRVAIESYADNVPLWMLNRQRDLETGNEIHLTGQQVRFTLQDDIDRLRTMKCYRGIRHASGNKVRGQRGRSNGRGGLTLGVSRKK